MDKHAGWTNQATWLLNLRMSTERKEYYYWTSRVAAIKQNTDALPKNGKTLSLIGLLAHEIEAYYENEAETALAKKHPYLLDFVNLSLQQINYAEIATEWLS